MFFFKSIDFYFIYWSIKNSREVPVKNCKPKSVHVPTQERLHRKKCLLPDEEKVTPAQEDYGIPAAEPVSSYSG